MDRFDFLTIEDAAETVGKSVSWVRQHCGDNDFPRRYYVFDNRQKLLKRDDWYEYCEQRELEIVKLI